MTTILSKKYILQKKSINIDSSCLILSKTNILGFNEKEEKIKVDDILKIEIGYRKSTSHASFPASGGGRTHLWCTLKVLTTNGEHYFDIAENDLFKQKIAENLMKAFENSKLKNKINYDPKIREMIITK